MDLTTQLKILTPKQMCQRLPLALAQVKAGNTSEKLRNEIEQKKSLKKCITIQWIQSRYDTKMDTILMNSKNSKSCDPQ